MYLSKREPAIKVPFFTSPIFPGSLTVCPYHAKQFHPFFIIKGDCLWQQKPNQRAKAKRNRWR